MGLQGSESPSERRSDPNWKPGRFWKPTTRNFKAKDRTEGSHRCQHYHCCVFAVPPPYLGRGYFPSVRQNIEVPAQAVLITSCIAFVSSLCNPIIYSIRKIEFRRGVKNVFRRIGLHAGVNDVHNNVIGTNNLRFGANPGTDMSTSTSAAAIVRQHYGHGRLNGSTERTGVNSQRRCLSPIPEISDKDD